MSQDEISNYVKFILSGVNKGVEIYKTNLKNDKTKINLQAMNLIELINKNKENNINQLDHVENQFDEIVKLIKNCPEDLKFATDINTKYCEVLKTYQLFNFTHVTQNTLNQIKNYYDNNFSKNELIQNTPKFKENNENFAINNTTIVLDFKEEIKLTDDIHNSKNKCEEKNNNSSNINLINPEETHQFLNKKRKIDLSEKNENQIESDNINKVSCGNDNNYTNESNTSTNKEILTKLKAKFHNYNVDFKKLFPYLKKGKIMNSFEFNKENIDKTYEHLNEFIKENKISLQEESFLLLKFKTNKQENCSTNSSLYNRLKDYFFKRCATFKSTDLVIGGLTNGGINIKNIIEEIKLENFLDLFSINSIEISIYYFLEDVLNDVEEFNSKMLVHNIEKGEFKERKDYQQKLKKFRKGYKQIINN